MQVFTDKDIEEFRRIWQDEFGELLTEDRARMEAESLLQVIYQVRSIHDRALKKRKQQAGDK